MTNVGFFLVEMSVEKHRHIGGNAEGYLRIYSGRGRRVPSGVKVLRGGWVCFST